LETEIRQQGGKLTAAEVFRLALAQAARDMASAAAGLDRAETGSATQQAEQSAAASLARLIAALEPAKPKPGEPGGDADQGGGGQQSQRSVVSLAELKLLKLMQEDLNARCQALRQSKPTPRLAAQIDELAVEQGRLAELAQKMSQPVEADPADDSQDQPPPAEPPNPAPKRSIDAKENEI
jgi:hypothetical protein